MKQKWLSLMALVLCAALLLPSVVMAREVTPEDFLAMTDDAQEQYLENSGMSYEEAAGWSTDGGGSMMDDGYVQCDICGGWYMNGNEFRNHLCEPYDPWEYENTDGGGSLIDDGYVQCAACGGWYMNGNEFRNHFCTGDINNPSSSWTSSDDYYNALVQGNLNADTTTAIGTLYVNTANGKSLNMRSRPNTNSGIITTIPNGSAVTLFWYENSSWAYVAYRSYFGFCMTSHLAEYKHASTTSSVTESAVKKMYQGFQHVRYEAIVNPVMPFGTVNMYWGPSKNVEVQCVCEADTILEVLATNGTWSQVYNGLTDECGFIMNKDLIRYLQ